MITRWQDPVFTRDCCWLLGYDLLKLPKTEVGHETLIYRAYRVNEEIEATVYEFEIDGLIFRAAIADYQGGKLVWTKND